MYRAIPEVNRLCAMADRSRSYRLHQEALARIKNRPATFKESEAVSKGSIPSYAGSTANDDGNSTYARSTSLLSKAQKEKQIQIYNENQKILKAIEYQSPTICRADFYEHELDHQRQVSRMTGKTEIYGFPVTKDKNRTNLNQKNKSKKTKNFDPGIVRPIPKKFDIASFEKAESNANSKSNSSNKSPQKTTNKNNSSNEGKLDDILSSGANGLIDSSKDNTDDKNTNTSQKTEDENKSGGELDKIIADGVNGLNSEPKTEEKDKKDDSDESSEGELNQIVGNGVNSLTGDGK